MAGCFGVVGPLSRSYLQQSVQPRRIEQFLQKLSSANVSVDSSTDVLHHTGQHLADICTHRNTRLF